jgi:hypothetical protein
LNGGILSSNRGKDTTKILYETARDALTAPRGDLERENERLGQLVAELSLQVYVLKEGRYLIGIREMLQVLTVYCSQ